MKLQKLINHTASLQPVLIGINLPCYQLTPLYFQRVTDLILKKKGKIITDLYSIDVCSMYVSYDLSDLVCLFLNIMHCSHA